MIHIVKNINEGVYTYYRITENQVCVILFEPITGGEPSEDKFGTAEDFSGWINQRQNKNILGDYSKIVKGEWIDLKLQGNYYWTRNRAFLSRGMYGDYSLMVASCRDKRTLAFRNILADSFVSKNSISIQEVLQKQLPVAIVAVPCASNSLIENEVILCTGTLGFTLVNHLNIEVDEIPSYSDCLKYLPQITLSGPNDLSPDAVGAYSVQITQSNAELTKPLDVYYESTGGYFPKNRITVTGSNTFRFHALGLVAGEQIKIKAGFKNFSGAAEKIITIS
jgi:hypothetical protein